MTREQEYRVLHVLHSMAVERTGWRGFFRRWHISHEPLRNDAANLVREIGYGEFLPYNTRLVGAPTGRETSGEERQADR